MYNDDYRDRTYCRSHCKGFRDTGGRCFADGECEKYTEYMAKKKQPLTIHLEPLTKAAPTDAEVEHYADVVEAVFRAEEAVLPEWKERLLQAPTLNSADRLHLARDYTRAIAREILNGQTITDNR